MLSKRTPHWVIAGRFLLLASPPGLFSAFLALLIDETGLATIIMLSYFGALIVFWGFMRLFTNTSLRIIDPRSYKVIKRFGGDPFYDSVGAPLNFDSEAVRTQNSNPHINHPHGSVGK